MLISFPKSGRTFVRAMLSRLLQRRFRNFDERRLLEFPWHASEGGSGGSSPATTHAGDAMRAADEIRLNPADYKHCRVVLLARHPGDVAVSRYHHLKSRPAAATALAVVWPSSPSRLSCGATKGEFPRSCSFMNQWAELARKREGVGIVRYEDFLTDPRATLNDLANKIGLEVSSKDIEDAAELAAR